MNDDRLRTLYIAAGRRIIHSVEVYTPVPAEAVRRPPRVLWIVGLVVVLVALAVPAAFVLRYTPQPDFRNFGTVQTRFGTAGVVCGGDTAPRCGEATGLDFPRCTQEVRAYFTNHTGIPDTATNSYQDKRARALLGKRPPTGSQWYFLCGWKPLMQGGPAHLAPS